ncbi:hypothetical protein TRVL_01331 [Trypanosoma vivax]|nr:hypothetical protein TRVL_01331 [Trypanosoma vivax]
MARATTKSEATENALAVTFHDSTSPNHKPVFGVILRPLPCDVVHARMSGTLEMHLPYALLTSHFHLLLSLLPCVGRGVYVCPCTTSAIRLKVRVGRGDGIILLILMLPCAKQDEQVHFVYAFLEAHA